jgi:predicted nucleic acid-binding protein
MYLVDTNIWLERLLEQKRAEQVKLFLDHVPSELLFMTDFAFHSIGVVLTKLNRTEALLDFVEDSFIEGAVVLIHLKPEDTKRLIDITGKFSLDFDDAYQYLAAELSNLDIVSFDSDFDRTERGRKTPADILKKLKVTK